MTTVEEAVREAAQSARARHPHLVIQLSRRGGPTPVPADERTVAAFRAIFGELGQTATNIAASVEASTAGALVTLFAAGADAETWSDVTGLARSCGARVAIRKNAAGATAFVFWDAR